VISGKRTTVETGTVYAVISGTRVQ